MVNINIQIQSIRDCVAFIKSLKYQFNALNASKRAQRNVLAKSIANHEKRLEHLVRRCSGMFDGFYCKVELINATDNLVIYRELMGTEAEVTKYIKLLAEIHQKVYVIKSIVQVDTKQTQRIL